MMGRPQMAWLQRDPAWAARMKAAEQDEAVGWSALVGLADADLDLLQNERLDRLLQRRFPAPPEGLATRPVRLALLGSSTTAHLQPGIRIGALRRGLFVTIHEPDYGQFQQELLDPDSALHRFRPDVVLFAFDSRHLAGGLDAAADGAEAAAAEEATLTRLAGLWRLARERFGCAVVQQTALPVLAPLLGSNEHALPGSAAALLARLNAGLRRVAAAEGVALLAVDTHAARDGIGAWHDPVLWHRGKQEISPAAAPLYGDLLARLLAALQGRSAKCLVLDLDNTLWGGVIGDDGVEGIALGQGSALGEAFVAFQDYARSLARRGVILAVCSKNDEANARAPFERHPEMRLALSDIASFVANWNDKPANIRAIAQDLNIGLDSLVFVDDNPFERALVRRELPMVAVPELPDEPALYAECVAAAGYFEAVAVTAEDRARGAQYQANRERAALAGAATDLESYLRSLEMRLLWRRFDRIGLARIVQLINKTNQFNLTTRRYDEAEVVAVMEDPRAFGLQLRLIDRFGDNGIIAIVIGRLAEDGDLVIDTWLMSCRVLGRQVEEATLDLVAEQARRLGARRLIGDYRPTERNGMVAEHYAKLGFTPIAVDPGGAARYALDLAATAPRTTCMTIAEG